MPPPTALPSSPLAWMVQPLRRYADFEGRSPALEFWMYSLFLFLGYLAIALVVVAFTAIENAFVGPVASIGFLGWFIANIIPGIALTVRRFHDLGLSGHMTWLVYVAMLFLSILAWFGYLVVMSLPGKREANRWGPPVYDDHLPDVFG